MNAKIMSLCAVMLSVISSLAMAQTVPTSAQLDQGNNAKALGQYGYEVATNGHFIAVSTGQSGDIDLYQRDNNDPNVWSRKGALKPQGSGRAFGQQMDFDGDTMAVVDGQRGAYIFKRDPNAMLGWSQVQFLSAPGAATIRLKGNLLALGAPTTQNTSGQRTGIVYLYGRNMGGANPWSAITTIEAPKPSANQWFGAQLALTNDTVIASAFDGPNGNLGYVSFWEPDTQGVYKEVFRQEGQQGSLFLGGYGLAARPDEVVATGGQRMVFFERNAAGQWQQHATFAQIRTAGTASRPVFHGDQLAHFSYPHVNIYQRTANGWTVKTQLQATQATANSYQVSVPLDYTDGTLVLGAWRHSLTMDQAREGAAFVWIDTPDACTDDPCDTNATCADALFTAACTCNTGFDGDGLTCADVDECAQALDNCADTALCTNTDGGFTCACDDGYQGDGVTCDDIDECANPDTCPTNATCTNTPGNFTCVCDAGYEGDACTDVDECAQNLDDCADSDMCINTDGSFMCQPTNTTQDMGPDMVDVEDMDEEMSNGMNEDMSTTTTPTGSDDGCAQTGTARAPQLPLLLILLGWFGLRRARRRS